ncbi:MAG: hypothetical protein E7266_02610 [Lachnospiraceae bacterium]|nr:hypothetical protein [Lachnospiraceae bacterium]
MKRLITFIKTENEGISFVEIIVSLAIAGIVLVLLSSALTQGVSIFRKQSTVADLIGESQFVAGQLEQSIMEANEFTIYRDTVKGEIFVYTGRANHDSNCWIEPTGVERTIVFSGTKLYISKEYCSDVSQLNEGNLLSSYVDEFNIKISESSIERITDEAGGNAGEIYVNPIVVRAEYVLKNEDNEKAAALTIKIRNEISNCYDGVMPEE